MRTVLLGTSILLIACSDGDLETCDEANCLDPDTEREPDTSDTDTAAPDPTFDPLVDNPHPANPACDGVGGTPAIGATTWFAGEFEVGDDAVSGLEAWALLPNESWQIAALAEDCVVMWRVTGTGEDCIDCTYRMSLDYVLDPAISTCLADFVDAQDPSFTAEFDVQVSPSGDARLTFATSGRVVGTGTQTDGVLTWRSISQCNFF